MSSLTIQQRQIIEEKKRKALELRKNATSAKRFALSTHDNVPLARKTTSSGGPIMNGNSTYCQNASTSRYSSNDKSNLSANGISTKLFFSNKELIDCPLSLLSEERFVADLLKYNQPVIDAFKTIPEYRYDSTTKRWTFPINRYDQFLVKMKQLSDIVQVRSLPQFLLQCLKTPRINYSTIDLSSIDAALRETLMPFQREGVCFAIERNGRCMIADEMGLGKTFQALAIASYYRNNWPLLIATTSSMRNTWQEKIQEYLPSVPLVYVQHMTTAKTYIDEAKILIISHDLMSKCVDKLLERNFGVIIIDESHIFKNFKTKCTQAALKMTKQAKRVILLTGTPCLSRPSELYTQLKMIDDKFVIFREYSIRYCDGHETKFGWDSNGQSNLQELEVILNKKFLIRRTKDKVLGDLPEKTRETVQLDEKLLELSKEEKVALTQMASDYSSKKRATEKQAALLTFFSETAKLKCRAVCAYITDLLEKNKKFLVFCHHQVMLDAICELLFTKKKKHIRIDGRTTMDQRSYFVERFQVDSDYRAAVLSITAANAGITLTAAEYVIFAELHWNPSILAQAESRAHRIGQENTVRVIYLLADSTADGFIWPLIQEKQGILNEAGLSEDSFKIDEQTKQEVSGEFETKPTPQRTVSDYFAVSKNDTIDKAVVNVNKNAEVLADEIKDTLDMTADELEKLFNEDDDFW